MFFFSNDYNVSSCNDELDQDLEGALKAIEGEEMVSQSQDFHHLFFLRKKTCFFTLCFRYQNIEYLFHRIL